MSKREIEIIELYDEETGKVFKLQKKYPNLAAGRWNPHKDETKRKIAQSMQRYWAKRRAKSNMHVCET